MREAALARIIDDDGIDVVLRIDQNSSPEEIEAWFAATLEQPLATTIRATVRSFEIAYPKAAAAANDPTLTLPIPSPQLSLDAYAYRIIRHGRRLLQRLKRYPKREADIRLALMFSQLVTDARWKAGRRGGTRGVTTKTGLRRRREQHRAGKKSGKTRSEKHRPAIEQLAREIRRARPYSRPHSTRWLAREIARRLTLPSGTVRSALHALGLK
jgi:hypothetical protein